MILSLSTSLTSVSILSVCCFSRYLSLWEHTYLSYHTLILFLIVTWTPLFIQHIVIIKQNVGWPSFPAWLTEAQVMRRQLGGWKMDGCIHKVYRVLEQCLASSKILTPHPLSTQRVCPPTARVWGGGGSIFWKTPDIGLTSYSMYNPSTDISNTTLCGGGVPGGGGLQ